jgi:hypothetical protein
MAKRLNFAFTRCCAKWISAKSRQLKGSPMAHRDYLKVTTGQLRPALRNIIHPAADVVVLPDRAEGGA